MVAGFSRSFSLPGSPRPKSRSAPQRSYHVRSISLPCSSHPLVSHLEDEIRSVNTWRSSQPESASTPASSAWLCDGMARLELLHSSLHDLLGLPQNQDSLRLLSGSSELDGFLRLADSHGCLRSNIIAMNDHQSEAQIAVRRNDGVKLESCVRSMKKAERQLVKHAASLRLLHHKSTNTEAVLVGIIKEVINVTVSASTALFIGMAAASSAVSATVAVACSSTSKSSWMSSSKRRPAEVEVEKGEGCRRTAMAKLLEFEECIGAVEKKSERVLRCRPGPGPGQAGQLPRAHGLGGPIFYKFFKVSALSGPRVRPSMA